MTVFRENGDLTIRIWFQDPQDPQKAHSCAEPRLLAYFAWRLVRDLGCSLFEEPKKKNEIIAEPEFIFHAYVE